jgi:serine/threonine protein kinase
MASFNQEGISVSSGILKKKNTLDPLGLEYEKQVAVFQIALNCKKFKVPRPISFDKEICSIEMEYLPGLSRLPTLESCDNDLVTALAAVLVEIHTKLKLGSEFEIEGPVWLCRHQQCFVHGDFNCENICIDTNDGKLVVIDWSTSHIYGAPFTKASPMLDISFFILYSFFQKPSLKKVAKSGRLLNQALHFVAEYLRMDRSANFSDELVEYIAEVRKRVYPSSSFHGLVRKGVFLYGLLIFFCFVTRVKYKSLWRS